MMKEQIRNATMTLLESFSVTGAEQPVDGLSKVHQLKSISATVSKQTPYPCTS